MVLTMKGYHFHGSVIEDNYVYDGDHFLDDIEWPDIQVTREQAISASFWFNGWPEIQVTREQAKAAFRFIAENTHPIKFFMDNHTPCVDIGKFDHVCLNNAFWYPSNDYPVEPYNDKRQAHFLYHCDLLTLLGCIPPFANIEYILEKVACGCRMDDGIVDEQVHPKLLEIFAETCCANKIAC